MATANIYLNFNGNCEEAFNFYRSVFGGEFGSINRFNEMPPQDAAQAMPEELGNQIMHISLPMEGNTVLMGSDVGIDWAPHFQPGNNFSISVNVNGREEADRVYNALSENGNSTMPMADTFWGDYFGMCTDQFGINWMVSGVGMTSSES
ncbi:MAG: VOC family protein [Bacteroidetes bacterium]|nr:VOC family protein [Bacteroidota bacterium]